MEEDICVFLNVFALYVLNIRGFCIVCKLSISMWWTLAERNLIMNTRKIVILAMFCAIAFILAATIRVPVVLFLRYDPKDVIIAIAGFTYGPMAAFMVTVVVATIQMFTVSATGLWGLLMNIIGSASFCCTAAYIYKRNRTIKGAVLGLIAGFVFAVTTMMMWNYIVTPIFMGVPREDVVALLVPAFLPFNLIQYGLNAALTMLLYKHFKRMMKATSLLPSLTGNDESESSLKVKLSILGVAGFVAISCILWWLILRGVI